MDAAMDATANPAMTRGSNANCRTCPAPKAAVVTTV